MYRSTRRRFLASTAAGFISASGAVAIGRRTAAAQESRRPGYKIIDSHVHLKHGNVARTEYSPETIVATMDAVRIDQSVVFAICTTTRQSIEMAKRAARKYSPLAVLSNRRAEPSKIAGSFG